MGDGGGGMREEGGGRRDGVFLPSPDDARPARVVSWGGLVLRASLAACGGDTTKEWMERGKLWWKRCVFQHQDRLVCKA